MSWSENKQSADNQASIIFDDDALVLGNHGDNVQSPASRPKKSGLSELSKQLRALQSTNHDQAADIDKLERKLKIMSDLKGVSVHDLKAALMDACEGEAFNELRAQVDTLRAQLEIASSSKSSPSKSSSTIQPFEHKLATDAIANMELRVGELEEIEESLRAEISKLYEMLREQEAKSTRLESSNATYQRQVEEWETKYNDREQQLQSDHDAALTSLQGELEATTSRAMEAEVYLRRQKERVEASRIQVAEYQGMELQLTQQRNKIKELNENLERQEAESKSTLSAESKAAAAKLEIIKNRATDAEAKMQAATEKIGDLEQQVAKQFSLELMIAKQKVQLKQLTEQTAMSSQQTIEVHKVEADTARAEMDKLQKRAGAVEAKLQAELARSSSLEKEVSRMKELEQQLAEQQEELSAQRKNIDKYKKEREKASKAHAATLKKEAEAYESRTLELQNELTKWRKRVSELDEQVTVADDQNAKHKQQTKEIEKLTKEKERLSQEEKKQRKENADRKAEIAVLAAKVQETEMQLKLEKAKAESLEKQIKSTEDEAKLRKKQFKSRFKVQDERIADLEQQLSSLYTAFNMERGERTEEQRTQAVLQMSLGEADSKVAHQMHNIEEDKLNPRSPGAPNTPGSTTKTTTTRSPPPGTPGTPQQLQHQQSPQGELVEVGIAQGFLFKKDKFKGWKKRYCFLHGNLAGGNFTLSYSDGPNKPTKGSVPGIQTSLSRVQVSNEFPKQPHAFVLKVNPYDTREPTIYLAAANKSDLDTWISAFAMATQGIQTETVSSAMSMSYPVGSQVVIVDLINHPEYNGLTGVITSPLDNERQTVMIAAMKQKVKLSPANLELFALPDETRAMQDQHGGGEEPMRYGV
jgi:chromosome segregation ATPase